jgi:WD40 repeat protein
MCAIPGKVSVVSKLFHDPSHAAGFHDPNDLPLCGEGSEFESSARYITGDRDGNVAVWRLVIIEGTDCPRLKLVRRFNVSSVMPSVTSVSVRSLSERQGTLLIGTHGAEIFEISMDDIPYVYEPLNSKRRISATASQSKDPLTIDVKRLISGHSKGELWGLAVHPTLPVYFTCGDDATVRCWTLKPEHKLLSYVTLPLGEKLRAIDILPTDGSELAVSLNSGQVWVIGIDKFLAPKSQSESG